MYQEYFHILGVSCTNLRPKIYSFKGVTPEMMPKLTSRTVEYEKATLGSYSTLEYLSRAPCSRDPWTKCGNIVTFALFELYATSSASKIPLLKCKVLSNSQWVQSQLYYLYKLTNLYLITKGRLK